MLIQMVLEWLYFLYHKSIYKLVIEALFSWLIAEYYIWYLEELLLSYTILKFDYTYADFLIQAGIQVSYIIEFVICYWFDLEHPMLPLENS